MPAAPANSIDIQPFARGWQKKVASYRAIALSELGVRGGGRCTLIIIEILLLLLFFFLLILLLFPLAPPLPVRLVVF